MKLDKVTYSIWISMSGEIWGDIFKYLATCLNFPSKFNAKYGSSKISFYDLIIEQE